MIDGLPNREAALAWEKAQVRAYRAANNGARPPKQYRPLKWELKFMINEICLYFQNDERISEF